MAVLNQPFHEDCWQQVGASLRALLGDEACACGDLDARALSDPENGLSCARQARGDAEAVHRIATTFFDFARQWLALPVDKLETDDGTDTVVAVPQGGPLTIARVRREGDEIVYGFSPRAMLALAACHDDRHGAVLPPRVAPTQVLVSATAASAESYAASLVGYIASPRLRARQASVAEPLWRPEGIPVWLAVGPEQAAANEVMVRTRIDDTVLCWPRMGLKARLVDHLDALQLRLRNLARERVGRG